MTLSNDYLQTLALINEISSRTEPLKERFFTLLNNKIKINIPALPPCELTKNDETPLIDDYKLVLPTLPLNNSSQSLADSRYLEYGTDNPRLDTGITYAADVMDYDGNYDKAYFTIPLSYLDDPDAWEDNALGQMKDAYDVAYDALFVVFGEKLGDELYKTVHANYSSYGSLLDGRDSSGFDFRFLNVIPNWETTGMKEAIHGTKWHNLLVDTQTGNIYPGRGHEKRILQGKEDGIPHLGSIEL